MGVCSKIFNNHPIVLTSHGFLDYRGKDAWKYALNRLYDSTLGLMTLNNVDRIIALSIKNAELLEKIGADRNKISIVPNWIIMDNSNFDIDKEAFRTQLHLKNKIIILFVGSIIKRKGLNYLIESMIYVNPAAILLIIGSEISGHRGVKHSLEKQIKNLGLKNIFFLGKVSDDYLRHAYSIADLVVIPSLSEGLPITLLEAMSYKKSIIATNIPGVSDVIRDEENGLLVPPANSVELAKKINYLIDNPEIRYNLGSLAEHDIKISYNSNKIIKKIESIYNSLVC